MKFSLIKQVSSAYESYEGNLSFKNWKYFLLADTIVQFPVINKRNNPRRKGLFGYSIRKGLLVSYTLNEIDKHQTEDLSLKLEETHRYRYLRLDYKKLILEFKDWANK